MFEGGPAEQPRTETGRPTDPIEGRERVHFYHTGHGHIVDSIDVDVGPEKAAEIEARQHKLEKDYGNHRVTTEWPLAPTETGVEVTPSGVKKLQDGLATAVADGVDGVILPTANGQSLALNQEELAQLQGDLGLQL